MYLLGSVYGSFLRESIVRVIGQIWSRKGQWAATKSVEADAALTPLRDDWI